MITVHPKFIRKFIGYFPGQVHFLDAEVKRRGSFIAPIAREILDLGIEKYRKLHKLPAAYPSNGLEKDE